jgi:hypothetical protein
MQIKYVSVPYEWVLLEDLIPEVEDGGLYMIESRGPGNIIIRESDSMPAKDDYGGALLDKYAYKIALYKNNDANLYVRLERSSLSSAINVTSIAEEE